MPAVAATESWKARAWTMRGSATRSNSTAPPSRLAVSRGRPANAPSSARDAITLARRTEGSQRVTRAKKPMVSSPRANRAEGRARASAARPRAGASTMATLEPETATRCPSPVARKSSSISGSIRLVSPIVSPSRRPASRSGRARAAPRDRALRAALARRRAGFVAGPRTSRWATVTVATTPRRDR